MYASNGTIAVASTSMNSTVRPGNRYFANTAPAITDVITTLMVETTEMNTLLRKKRPNGAAVEQARCNSPVSAPAAANAAARRAISGQA